MAISRPTLQQLDARADAVTLARIPGSSPALRRGLLRGILRACVGMLDGLYRALAERSKDCTPWEAVGDALIRWAALWSFRLLPAYPASGAITIAGADGATIARGSSLQNKRGIVYATDEDVTISSGTAVVSVTAILAGASGNLDGGEKLTFLNPPVGVNAVALVGVDGMAGGADVETWQQLKVRFLARLAKPPHGGNKFDYVAWAREVPTITRAWCFDCYKGPGSVRVYVVNDNYVGAATAAPGDVTAVANHIDPIKPCGMQRWGRLTAANFIADPGDAGALIPNPANPPPTVSGLEVVAPAKHAINFTISGVTDLTVRAQMQAAMQALIAAQAVPEGGIQLAAFYGELYAAANGASFALVSPSTNQAAAAGEILWPGTFTWA